MKRILIVAALALLPFQGALADYSATYFEKGSGRSKKLFTSEHKITSADGKDVITSRFLDDGGTLLYQETSTVDGANLVKSEIEQKQTGASALIEVKEGKIFFTKTTDGKSKTSDEKLKDSLVTSGNFSRFVQKNIEALKSGKTLDFRFGVWDRQETVGFSVFKTGEEDIGGQKAIVLKMKPSSFIIAALVDPLIFKYSMDGSQILEMIGRVPVKKKVGDSFKDQDAEVVYKH